MDFALLGLAALREQARRVFSPPKPARNRLDSRTLVRTPSITGGMGSCGTPRIRKTISAASPGESTLEPMPTPCTPDFLIHSSARAAWTTFARAISASGTEYTSCGSGADCSNAALSPADSTPRFENRSASMIRVRTPSTWVGIFVRD